MEAHNLPALRRRVGDDYVTRRLRAQAEHKSHVAHSGRGGFHLEDIPFFMPVVRATLRVSGLARLGARNALSIRPRENKLYLRGLPPSFDDMRILQLSDLHLDARPGFGRRIAESISGLAFDICVLTGDFRFRDTGGYDRIIPELSALAPALHCRFGAYGILGNHDYIEMVPLFERLGVRMLVNEAAALDGGGNRLWLVGVDDPHFYGLHDFARSLRDVPEGEPRILLAHSPEVIREARARDFLAYLSGHTHGGQICLPGGFAPYINARCPRRFMKGAWCYEDMSGYTSLGTGSSGVFARFFCPPEVVIHRLRATDAPRAEW